jgi:hypothetical protein
MPVRANFCNACKDERPYAFLRTQTVLPSLLHFGQISKSVSDSYSQATQWVTMDR